MVTAIQLTELYEKQRIDVQIYQEHYCKVLSVFAFNSAKDVTNLIKPYLLPMPKKDCDIEPLISKRSHQLTIIQIRWHSTCGFSGSNWSNKS